MKEKKVSLDTTLLKYGEVIKENIFETERGVYDIKIIKYCGKLYFHKAKNGQTVEIVKLN